MKKLLIIYIILILFFSLILRYTKRIYILYDEKVSSYETSLKENHLNISNSEIKRLIKEYKSNIQPDFFREILKPSLIISTIIIILPFFRYCLIKEFFHL